MIDFSKYDGYGFEDLITKLLKTMGFLVEQTSLSGDGGIDIIVHDERPITKGKYIIQCKNWTNLVGEPPIRDLFGTVMSERANKGILITTSSFTKQAKKFADGKNLELIDYNSLVKIFKDNNISVNEELKDTKKMFYEYDEFEKDKYWYIKSKIDEDKTAILYYKRMQEFLHYYIISNKYRINNSGLIDEYIAVNNEIIKRFYKRKKKDNHERDNIEKINMYLYLIKGEIFKSIEIYKELGVNLISGNLHMFLYWENYGDIKEGIKLIYGSESVFLKNLLVLLHFLKFQDGEKWVTSLFDKAIADGEEEIKRYEGHPAFVNEVEQKKKGIAKFKKSKIDISCCVDTTIIYPIRDERGYIYYSSENTVNVQEFIGNYYSDENEIIKELEKTKLLFI